MVLFELMTGGDVPYAFFDDETTYKKVKAGYRLEAPDNCPPALYSLMCSCWDGDPDLRPSFKDVYAALEKIQDGSDRSPDPPNPAAQSKQPAQSLYAPATPPELSPASTSQYAQYGSQF